LALPFFDLEQTVSYRISTLYSRLSLATSRQLAAGFGLALREWRTLALLARHEPTSASTLVARSPMDKASVSRAVASLKRRRLIATRRGRGDARTQRLVLTQEGRRLYRRIAPLSAIRQTSLLSALTRGEHRALLRILDKLVARAGEMLEEGAAIPIRRKAKPENR
jgi:DNA-binding MarR family transcriptional regulator